MIVCRLSGISIRAGTRRYVAGSTVKTKVKIVTKKKIFDRKGVILVSMYIFYLFDFFLFSVLEKRERKYGIETKLDLDL
jgi:hypothetical protein